MAASPAAHVLAFPSTNGRRAAVVFQAVFRNILCACGVPESSRFTRRHPETSPVTNKSRCESPITAKHGAASALAHRSRFDQVGGAGLSARRNGSRGYEKN